MTLESNSPADRLVVGNDPLCRGDKSSGVTETREYASECWAQRPDNPARGAAPQSDTPPLTQPRPTGSIGSIISDLGKDDFRTREGAYTRLQEILGGFRNDVVTGRKVKDTADLDKITAGLFSPDLEVSERIGKSLHECFRTFGSVPLRERLSMQTLQVLTDVDSKPKLEALRSTLDKDAPDWAQKTRKSLDLDLFAKLDTKLQSHRSQLNEDTKAATQFGQILKDLANPETLVAEFRTEYALLHAKQFSGGKITQAHNLPDATDQLIKALKDNPQLAGQGRFLKIAALTGADTNQQFTALLVDDKAKDRFAALVKTYGEHTRVECDPEIDGEYFDW